MKQAFIDNLLALGGKATNKTMLESLQQLNPVWDRTTYLATRAELLAEGQIKLGRGRGGTVIKL